MMTRSAPFALVVVAVILLAAYITIVQQGSTPSAGISVAENSVANGNFSNSSSITYIHGFRLGPVAFCPTAQSSPSPIEHRWGVLHSENSLQLGNQSMTRYGVATVDSRRAFYAFITPGEGARISLLQLLGTTRVNTTTRVHFAIDSLNSTSQIYSSIIVVLGPIWQKGNGTPAAGYSFVMHLDSLPNRSGWYDFDFSLYGLIHGLTGTILNGPTFAGPCLSSRGVSLGLETASILEDNVFHPSPALGLAFTDVAVYDSSSGKDTMYKGSPFQYYLNSTATSSESSVSVTTYSLEFPLPPTQTAL